MQIKFDDDEAMEVQMAPLIDCVFLLLTFFLVATTLKELKEELPLELPDSAVAVTVQQADDQLEIGIDIAGEVYLNAVPVTTTVLHETLQRVAAHDLHQRIRIDVDRNTPFQHVVHVFDLCQFEGLKNVGIHTAQNPKKQP